MSPTSDLSDYLRSEEPLRAAARATLSDDAGRKEVSVGVTDRRLICVADDDAYLAVGHDAVCAVRSRPRTRLAVRGNDYRVLVGTGALAVVLGLFGLVALASSLAVSVLALAGVGGLVATAALRRTDDVRELVPAAAIERRTAADFDAVAALRRLDRRASAHVDVHRLVVATAGLFSLGCLLGAASLASNPFVVALALPVAAGAALVDYGVRHRAALDGIEVIRRRDRAVRVHTADGRALLLAFDPSASIDRELGHLAVAADADPSPVLEVQS